MKKTFKNILVVCLITSFNLQASVSLAQKKECPSLETISYEEKSGNFFTYTFESSIDLLKSNGYKLNFQAVHDFHKLISSKTNSDPLLSNHFLRFGIHGPVSLPHDIYPIYTGTTEFSATFLRNKANPDKIKVYVSSKNSLHAPTSKKQKEKIKKAVESGLWNYYASLHNHPFLFHKSDPLTSLAGTTIPSVPDLKHFKTLPKHTTFFITNGFHRLILNIDEVEILIKASP